MLAGDVDEGVEFAQPYLASGYAEDHRARSRAGGYHRTIGRCRCRVDSARELTRDKTASRRLPGPVLADAMCADAMTAPHLPTHALESLWSGGQTGADRAALDVAIRHGFPHGGWCPKGRRAEDGVIDQRYQLRETPSVRYLRRTGWNVRDTDGTAVFSFERDLTGGTLQTVAYLHRYDKPFVHIVRDSTAQPELDLLRFIRGHGIRRLNVAGPRESTSPGMYLWVTEVIEALLNRDATKIPPAPSNAA